MSGESRAGDASSTDARSRAPSRSAATPSSRHGSSKYAAAFREAFELVVKALSEHDRVLLRQHHLDQLTIDELASLHKTHRATAARWVASARTALLASVRTRMIEKLAISGGELDSAPRLASSQLEVSIHRLIGGKRRR
jgi:RNA polymerase sigma-70 factor (ECF subfamily)